MTITPSRHLLLCLALCACAGTSDQTALLHSVVWVQTAAERDAVCVQVFKTATDAMRALTADLSTRTKPYAVVVDVDENNGKARSIRRLRLFLQAQS